jgi:hypothetical protein
MLTTMASLFLAASVVAFAQMPPVETIAAAPAADLAVGETVKLAAQKYVGATYSWRARCTTGLVFRTDPAWNDNQINDCIGSVGAERYDLDITLDGDVRSAIKVVTWNAPNGDLLEGLGVNSQGDTAPTLMTVELCFKQIWTAPNGAVRATGPCFTAFAQEKIVKRDAAGNVTFDSGWLPATSTESSPEFIFDSPCIRDLQGISFPDVSIWEAIPVAGAGAVFSKWEQQVRLTTSKCDETELILTSAVFKLQRRKVSDTAFVVEYQP